MRFWPDEYQREKILLWVSITIIFALLVSACGAGYEGGGVFDILCLLLLPIFVLVWVASFIAAITRWSMICWISFVCFILVFPGCPQAIKLGHWARIKVFEQRLPEYETVVKQVTTNFDGNFKRIDKNEMPESWRKLAYFIIISKDGNATVVRFIWGIGFPLKHTGFVWRSDGVLSKDTRGMWRINEHWFRFAD